MITRAPWRAVTSTRSASPERTYHARSPGRKPRLTMSPTQPLIGRHDERIGRIRRLRDTHATAMRTARLPHSKPKSNPHPPHTPSQATAASAQRSHQMREIHRAAECVTACIAFSWSLSSLPFVHALAHECARLVSAPFRALRKAPAGSLQPHRARALKRSPATGAMASRGRWRARDHRLHRASAAQARLGLCSRRGGHKVLAALAGGDGRPGGQSRLWGRCAPGTRRIRPSSGSWRPCGPAPPPPRA
jgi:hypothetical protein